MAIFPDHKPPIPMGPMNRFVALYTSVRSPRPAASSTRRRASETGFHRANWWLLKHGMKQQIIKSSHAPYIQWENLWFPVDFPIFFPYLMGKSMVSCRFFFKPVHWGKELSWPILDTQKNDKFLAGEQSIIPLISKDIKRLKDQSTHWGGY